MSTEQIRLLDSKGCCPYEYTTSFETLEETQLPPIEASYSCLTESFISEEDYERAQNIRRELNIQNLGQYCDTYMKVDVLLLADVFEQVREFGKSIYGVDAANFPTIASLSFYAMLLYTFVKIEKLTDPDHVLLSETGIRDGIAQCSNRYSGANNHYTENYDSFKDEIHLTYLDVCIILIYLTCSWAMTKPLPISAFKGVEKEQLLQLDFLESWRKQSGGLFSRSEH